ncbi:MAG: HNH endonuclease [Planctomycetaceae bacterium]|nr:HNH endonuclease [Planctomycetaceae bacterium]
MESSRSSDADAIQSGSRNAATLPRSVDSGGAEHGVRVEDSTQSGTPTPAITEAVYSADLGSRSTANESVSQHSGPRTSLEGDVGVLGKTSPPVESSQFNGIFRVGDLLGLLNSTPLGYVVSDRQLLRHRQNAGLMTSKGQVDLVRLMAWLRSDRRNHESQSETYRKLGKESGRGRRGEGPSPDEILALIERQDFRCALTGERLTPDTTALDHIIPISRNGAHTIENAQVVQKEVNRAKGTLANEEFIVLCRAVVAHTDSLCCNRN